MVSNWYQKILIKYKTEIISSVLGAFSFTLTINLLQYYSGQGFIWRHYEFISAPDIFQRTFYSALTFITLGAFLYFIRFYQALHFIIVEIIGSWSLYKGIKSLIWLFLMFTSYSYFPKLVDVINNIISFIVNLFFLILFVAPPLIFSFITFLLLFLVIRFRKQYAVLKN